MGLFSSKPKLPDYSDKVWKSQSYAIKGLMTDALAFLVKNEVSIIATHFQESHEQLISFLTENSVPHFVTDASNCEEASLKSKEVLVVDVAFISTTLPKLLSNLQGKTKSHLLFFGHYPLPKREDKLLENLTPFKEVAISFYSSMDNPLMAVFGATNVISLMEKLGMKEDEAIEHSMVTKAMQNARKKLEEKVTFEHAAHSEKEWFEKNLPKSI
jgi:preprotein translocase subunit SecA